MPGANDGLLTTYVLNLPRHDIPMTVNPLPDTADGARQ
jgi:hypothetical protein